MRMKFVGVKPKRCQQREKLIVLNYFTWDAHTFTFMLEKEQSCTDFAQPITYWL